MSDIDPQADRVVPTPPSVSGRVLRILGHAGTDVAVATVWAALIVVIVLFSGVVSQFAYVDF